MQLVENLTYTLWGLFSYWLELKQLPPWKPETLIVSQGLQCIFLGWEVRGLLRDISFYEKRRAKPPWPRYRIIPWNWELWLFHWLELMRSYLLPLLWSILQTVFPSPGLELSDVISATLSALFATEESFSVNKAVSSALLSGFLIRPVAAPCSFLPALCFLF